MKINLLFLRISSSFIDLSVVYTLSLLLNSFVPLNPYIVLTHIFLIIAFLYFFITYYLYGCTPGKYLLQLKMFTKQNGKPVFIDLVKRELIKYLLLLLPASVIAFFCEQRNDSFCTFIDFNVSIFITTILYFIGSTIFWLFQKTTWYDSISNIKIEKDIRPKTKLIRGYIYFLLFLFVSFLIISYVNNKNQQSSLSFLGFKYPIKFKSHIVNEEVKNHIDFLQSKNLSSKDYIFELFSKYDIVVLCEWNHREITQWDFIADIVKDQRFVTRIGHIFTEYGDVSKQTQLDSLINTKFKNEDILDKETAQLMLFKNLGFFNFIKTLNVINTKLPDSLKIEEHFTDSLMNGYLFENPNNWKRDSVMAFRIINKFNEIKRTKNRKKCLVVTNYRHAFGLVKKDGNEVNDYKENETRYLAKAFPGDVANVLINGLTMKKNFIFYPINHGIWDRAFSEINNKSVGFNFKDTPFGLDRFDLYPWSKIDLKYEDVFTGFVFINQIDKRQYNSYYPYREFGAEKEYITKHQNTNNKSFDLKNIIESYKYNKFKDETLWLILHGLYNFIPIFLFFLILGISVIIALFHLSRIILTKDLL